jgi:hypothetical protein
LSQAPGVGVFVAQNEQGRSAWLLLYDETDHVSRMPKLGQVRSKGLGKSAVRHRPQG